MSGVTGVSRPVKWIPLNMLVKRTLVTLVLLPIGIAFIVLGGIYFSLLITFILALAAWEYTRLMRLGGLQPALFLVVAGAMLLALGRAWNGFESAPWIISLLILASMTYHLVAFERGRDQSATDMGVTLAGMLYIGWIGAYLISLRALPDGMWWVLLALPAVWIANSGAYFIGSRWGRHKMSPRLSPKKSWEGYFGGILFGTLGGALLGYIYPVWLGAGSGHHPFERSTVGPGDVHPSHPGRPGGKHDQAPGRRQRFGQPLARSRRCLRPHRFLAVGRGNQLLHHRLVFLIGPFFL